MNRLQNVFKVSMLIVVLGFGATVYMMFWGPDHIELAGKSLEQIFSGDEWVAVLVVPLSVVIVAVSLLPFIRIIFPPQIKNGEHARATVLRVWDTGTTINDDPQIGLLVEAVTKEGNRFQAETKTLVSRLQVGVVQPGAIANILYDPQNTKRVQVVEFETAAGDGNPVETRLEQIRILREKGLLTEEEYQRKRQEIIRMI